MGFFSCIGSFFGGVVSAAKTIWSVATGVISAIGEIKEWFSSAKELKQAPRYDESNSTIDETLKMNELLEKQRSGFSKK